MEKAILDLLMLLQTLDWAYLTFLSIYVHFFCSDLDLVINESHFALWKDYV